MLTRWTGDARAAAERAELGVPPAEPEIEAALCLAVLLWAGGPVATHLPEIDAALRTLSPRALYDARWRRVWGSLQRLLWAGVPISEVTVEKDLVGRGLALDRWRNWLLDLWVAEPMWPEQMARAVTTVRDCARRRALIHQAAALAATAWDRTCALPPTQRPSARAESNGPWDARVPDALP